MNSKLTLIILSALGSLDVSVFDFVIIETCSRHTTACSRQACSSSDSVFKLTQTLFCSYSVNSELISIIWDVSESSDAPLFC